MNSIEIFHEKINAARLQLFKAELMKEYYNLLISFDVKEDAAYRYAIALNFQSVLHSKEFTPGEKAKVIELEERFISLQTDKEISKLILMEMYEQRSSVVKS
jgi:hypothetical protein